MVDFQHPDCPAVDRARIGVFPDVTGDGLRPSRVPVSLSTAFESRDFAGSVFRGVLAFRYVSRNDGLAAL